MTKDTHPAITWTAGVARSALDLHRLALAAAEAAQLPSPATPQERTGGHADPTAGAALDPRRLRVSDALNALSTSLGDVAAALDYERRRLSEALDTWQGDDRK